MALSINLQSNSASKAGGPFSNFQQMLGKGGIIKEEISWQENLPLMLLAGGILLLVIVKKVKK